jgi:hypothetical protein
MNIFYLDTDYKSIPSMMIDRHVVKMVLETAQLLCSAHKSAPYKITHYNHPCSVWVRKSRNNYLWLCEYGLELCKEYTYRYGKVHKSESILNWCKNNIPSLPDYAFCEPPKAMGEEFKLNSTVESYRNYYKKSKMYNKLGKIMATWTKRKEPVWWNEY